MPEIDVAGATAALEAAGGMPATIPASTSGTDPWQQAQATPTPAQAPAAQPETPADNPPEGGSAAEGEPDSFTKIDPATLAPELNQLYRGMQADFTRGKQEIAPWRKLAEETGIENPEQIREALAVYQRLQDPSNWQSIHQELGQYMQGIGMTPQAAQAAATEAIAEFAPSQEVDFSEYEGTELAPVLSAMQRLEAQNQALQARFEQQEAQRVEYARFQQVAAHIEKQEVALRAARPDYTDTDYENIYSLMGETPDLEAAANRYESMLAVRLQRYINTKEGGLAANPTPLAGGGVVTQAQPEGRPDGVDPVEWGHTQAMRQIAAMDRADAQS